jgi:hypothetical protein
MATVPSLGFAVVAAGVGVERLSGRVEPQKSCSGDALLNVSPLDCGG